MEVLGAREEEDRVESSRKLKGPGEVTKEKRDFSESMQGGVLVLFSTSSRITFASKNFWSKTTTCRRNQDKKLPSCLSKK